MSFFGKIENVFKKLFGQAPSALQKAQSVISYVAPLVKGIMQAVAPEDAATAGNVIGEITTDLATASTLISQSHTATDQATALTSVSNALGSVNTNLSALLAADHIKNPDTIAKITPLVGIATGELQAFLSSVQHQAA